MKMQPANQNTDRVRFRRGMKSNAWRSLSIVVLVLLVTATYSSAQIGPTTCTSPGIGLNECPSPQYRSGSAGNVFNYQTNTYNANLTGNPVGDVNVLNPGTVSQLVLLNPGLLASCGSSAPNCGCQSPTFGAPSSPLSPTASPSIESRIIFPALHTDSTGTYCALYTYGLVNPGAPQFVNKLGGTNPHTYVTSSPGYNGDVVVAAEDGNVYAYGFASNTLAWTFSNPAPNPYQNTRVPFDSSPAVWPNLSYVYVVDTLGDIYYLNPGSGTAAYSITSRSVYPGASYYQGTPYTPSASSLSVSTCAGGPYSPCNMLFVAGSNGSNQGIGDAVCAYNSLDATLYWCQYFGGTNGVNNVITSSPVVSDSLGRVYVQDFGSGGATLYALDQNPCALPNCNGGTGGNITWSAGLPLPNCFYDGAYVATAGSLAYDDTPQYAGPNTKYVIAVADYTYSLFAGDAPCSPTGFFAVDETVLAVYDAASGALVCNATIPYNSSSTNSSPEVVNGVIYIGTDEGFILAYEEPPDCYHGVLRLQATLGPMDSPMEGPPVVSFNRVHAVSQNGTLYMWHIPGW